MRTLDRLPEFDPRSRRYGIAATLDVTTPRSYTWRCDVWLDQGYEGACVGHAWAHENAARPVVRASSSELAFGIYYDARRVDQWPGEDYDGTSVLAGAKVMQQRGLLREYRWAFGLDEALAAISRKGPAVLGTNWYDSMFDPGPSGLLTVGGRVAGGHAILLTGVNVRHRLVRLHNSWGPTWGAGGDAFLSWDDLGRLLREDGEVCIPTLR